jgi:hypothetical protein
MGYIRRDISLGREKLEPELCQCTALVSGARAAGTSARLWLAAWIRVPRNERFVSDQCAQRCSEIEQVVSSGLRDHGKVRRNQSGNAVRHGNCLASRLDTSFSQIRYDD